MPDRLFLVCRWTGQFYDQIGVSRSARESYYDRGLKRTASVTEVKRILKERGIYLRTAQRRSL